MSKRTLVEVLLVALMGTAVHGCSRERDRVVDALNAFTPNIGPDEKALFKKRVALAISKWHNGRRDTEPILMCALLFLPAVTGHAYLGLFDFDEDKDIVGFGIREDYVDANGLKTSRTEEYPALTFDPKNLVVVLYEVPVQIRDAGQGMDGKRWQVYARGEGVDMNRMKSRAYWKESLPPIWVSTPKPKTVRVYVYSYNRTGHKSEPVELQVCR